MHLALQILWICVGIVFIGGGLLLLRRYGGNGVRWWTAAGALLIGAGLFAAASAFYAPLITAFVLFGLAGVMSRVAAARINGA
ncbi:hypothetical protein GCM10010335_18760 [Streptomyces galbus]|nr:hypothetical protein GCM10010335_18760 [Streptomyces galbus]